MIDTNKLALETATPSQNVLSVADCPLLQKSLKKIGKNPAITVVENAEFAQSYKAQLRAPLRFGMKLKKDGVQ